ncbi:MAG: hypothetical protein ACKVOO_04180 [Burkholderiaceae bacterium]
MPAQNPLFDDLLNPTAKPTLQALAGALGNAAPSLGLEQKRFNQWLAKISASQADLAALQALAEEYRRQYAQKIMPLLQASAALNKQMALFLDQRLQRPGLSKGQRAFMAEMVCELLEELMEDAVSDQEMDKLEEIYQRHSPADLPGYEQEQADVMRAVASKFLGIDLPPEAQFDSPEALLAAFEEHVNAALAAEQARSDAKAARQSARQAKGKSGRKKPSQQAAELTEQDASKTLREIYRKLASALHPDRAADEADRLRKTALMVQVNAANEKKDLLALLQLQLQTEQIDPLAIAEMAQDKLRHFNHVLSEQAASLQAEVAQLKVQLQRELRLAYGKAPSPQTLESSLRERAKSIEQQLAWRREDLTAIHDDRELKAWLKLQKKLAAEDY